MAHSTHGMGGDITSLFLIASNWITLSLSIHPMAIEWLQVIGLAVGVLASLVVFIDHSMKIVWKVKETKKTKRTYKKKNDDGDKEG